MASTSASADPKYLQDPGDAPLTEDEKRQQEAAALVVQALFKGKQDRIAMMVKRNATKSKNATAGRWALIAGRFSAFKPDIDGIMRWSELSHMFLPNDINNSSKVVLNNISGRVHAGSMLTVTGPAGCGKTTLMKILSKANLEGLTQGDVTFNGISVNDVPDYHRKVAYVLETAVMEGLTVYEQIAFSARLRINANEEFIKGRVDKVVDFMGLGGETLHTTLKSCTHAIQRRTGIAIELVTFPPVLLLDDPTVGLDSSASVHMMEILSKMGQKICVITTLDSSNVGDCWAAMEDMYVLAGGRLAYYGKSKDLNRWLKSTGYATAEEANPGDHLIRSIDDTFEDFSEKVVDKMVFTTYNNDLVRKMNNQIMLVTPPMAEFARNPVPGKKSSMLFQMSMLFLRYIKDGFLNPTKYPLQIFLSIFLGCLIGSMFQHMDHDLLKTDAKDVANLSFALATMTITFCVRPSARRMADEKASAIREMAGGFYSQVSYFLVHSLFAWLECMFFCLIISVLVVGIPGMIEDGPNRGDLEYVPSLGTDQYQPGTGWIQCFSSCANCDAPWFKDAGGQCSTTYAGNTFNYNTCNDLRNKLVPIIDCPGTTYAYQIYAHHVGILTFAAWATNSLVMFITMLSNTKDDVFIRTSIIDAVMLLFAGFLVSDVEMPYMWYPLYWGSHHNYAYRNILVNELKRRWVTIETGTTVQTGNSVIPSKAVDVSGVTYLQNEGFMTIPNDSTKPVAAPSEIASFLLLCAATVVYRLAAWGVLRYKYLKSVHVYPPPSALKDLVASPGNV